MWSDNDIDNAFRRLDPAEPEPTPFPLDAWLKLEAGLDQAVIDRAVRRRLWQFFAAEVAVVALVGLGWSLWPASEVVSAGSKAQTVAATTLPMGSGAATKRRLPQPASGTSTPAAPAAQAAAGNLLPAVPRPATTASAAPSATSATDAAAVSAAAPMRGVAASGRRLPLPVAVAPATRSRSAQGLTAAVWNREPAKPAARAFGHSENGLPAPPAGRNANAHSLANTSEGATSNSTAKTATHSASSMGTAASTVAGSRMAAPSRMTSEATTAGVASPNGGTPGAAVAASELTDSEPNAQAAATTLAGNTAPTTTAATHPTDADLPPAAATEVALVQPVMEPLPTQLAAAELAPAPLPAVVRQPRLYVGVVAAPDVSTVRFANVQAPHLNVGLTLEYRLGQRWRLATGVQRAVKEYYARREDYDWTNYPKAQTRDFSWVDGQCTVIDIPLNIRYDAVVQAHARWFGTAGLSSFFMHRENYSYDYLESGTYKNWEMPGLVNANQHLFSVLNLSAGYEYGLGTHWRLQAEPYVKVPLAGVGAGKVKLLSAGVYFGLKYGF